MKLSFLAIFFSLSNFGFNDQSSFAYSPVPSLRQAIDGFGELTWSTFFPKGDVNCTFEPVMYFAYMNSQGIARREELFANYISHSIETRPAPGCVGWQERDWGGFYSTRLFTQYSDVVLTHSKSDEAQEILDTKEYRKNFCYGKSNWRHPLYEHPEGCVAAAVGDWFEKLKMLEQNAKAFCMLGPLRGNVLKLGQLGQCSKLFVELLEILDMTYLNVDGATEGNDLVLNASDYDQFLGSPKLHEIVIRLARMAMKELDEVRSGNKLRTNIRIDFFRAAKDSHLSVDEAKKLYKTFTAMIGARGASNLIFQLRVSGPQGNYFPSKLLMIDYLDREPPLSGDQYHTADEIPDYLKTRRKNVTFWALTYYTAAISVLDAYADDGKMYSIPVSDAIPGKLGKIYHYWQAHTLTRKLFEKHPEMVNKKDAVLIARIAFEFSKLYEVFQTLSIGRNKGEGDSDLYSNNRSGFRINHLTTAFGVAEAVKEALNLQAPLVLEDAWDRMLKESRFPFWKQMNKENSTQLTPPYPEEGFRLRNPLMQEAWDRMMAEISLAKTEWYGLKNYVEHEKVYQANVALDALLDQIL